MGKRRPLLLQVDLAAHVAVARAGLSSRPRVGADAHRVVLDRSRDGRRAEARDRCRKLPMRLVVVVRPVWVARREVKSEAHRDAQVLGRAGLLARLEVGMDGNEALLTAIG